MGNNTKAGRFYGIIILRLLFLIATFLFSVQWMVLSFKFLNTSLIEHIVIATSNPFVSFFIGILITAMIQSSSTTTTMIVAIVASGTITLENAVFMVMGANIGTTVTSTLVSLGHVTRKKEFRRAIAAATLHDFFNILTAVILLPLEYYFGILAVLSEKISKLMFFEWNPESYIPQYLRKTLDTASLVGYEFIQEYDLLSLLLSLSLLILSIHLITRVFSQLILDQSPSPIEKYALQSPFRSLLIGALVSGALQSSSLVTSLIVQIAANNRLSLKNAFPFIMGANLGTTLTALMASLSSSEAALSIAMAHLLFNMIGILIFFPFRPLNEIPIRIARRLGKATLRNRMVGFVYIVLTFFVIPFLLIFLSRGNVRIKQYTFVHETPVYIGQKAEIGLRSALPMRLIYKQVSLSKDFKFKEDQDSELALNRSGDTIFINKQKFILGEVGFCWQDKDQEGKFTICIQDIKRNYILHPSLQIDTCYIFSKRYYSRKYNLFIHILYLDSKNRLPIKHEILDRKGNVLGREELMSLVQQ